MNYPKISVIMSVYNAETYLEKSINSILNQNFKNFEFIIINDGSTDNSLDIIKKYAEKDKRIIVINQENCGLTKSLNIGIKKAKGEYIARMDADDISISNRFEIQLKYLIELDLDFIFSQAVSFIKNRYYIVPENNIIEKFNINKLLFGNIFIHGTFFCKTEILKNNLYDENIKYAQDYELFLRLITKKYKFFIIPQILYYLRINENSISNKKKDEQLFYAKIVCKKYFNTTKYFIADKNIIIRQILKILRKIL
jgi:glycosyltransferase involved in cell wall biosynthesis